jgi:O-antigen ligase
LTLFIAMIAALVPVALIPGAFAYSAVLPKTVLILGGAAFLLLNFQKFDRGFEKLLRSQWGRAYAACVAIQILVILVSSVFSKRPVLSWFGTGWHRLGAVEYLAILFFCSLIAAWLVESPGALVVLLRALCVSGVVASLYGICQYFGGDPLLPKESYHIAFDNLSIVRPPSTFGNATYFANYLVLIIFMAVGLASLETSKYAKAAGWSAVSLACLALWLSGTRAGLIGVLAGLSFLLLRTRPRIAKKHALAAALVAIGLGTLYLTPLGARLRDRATQWIGDAKGGPRLMLWRDSLRMAAVHPLLGNGLETFASEFPKYQSASLARAYPDFYNETPHNICLDALLSEGWPGLILLLWSVYLGVSASFHWTRHRTCAAALAAGLAGVFISQQFTTFELSMALLFNLTIAASVAMADPEAVYSTLPARGFALLAMPLSALLLVIAGQMAYVDWRWASVQSSLAHSRTEAAMLRFEHIRHLFPPESGMDLWYSRAMLTPAAAAKDNDLRQRAMAQVLEAAIQAVDTSDDRPNALYNLAFIYSLMSDIPRAEATVRAAGDSAPNWFKPHWLLAEMLLASGNSAAAETQARLAIDLDGGKDPELAETLQRIRSKK